MKDAGDQVVSKSEHRAVRAPRICVLDSGVGGLTILAAMRAVIPSADWIYCCDNANFPYGPKSAEQVTDAVHRASAALVRRYVPDIFVVACNTASTVALPHLRADFPVPVIGVVPAIKPAAAATRTKTIGLLATPGTVTRPYVLQLIRDFAPDCNVLLQGSTQLVHLAEAKAHGKALDLSQIAAEVAPLFQQSPPQGDPRCLDTIVLGCTHFPLLQGEIRAVSPWPVTFIESGPAVAARAKTVLDGLRIGVGDLASHHGEASGSKKGDIAVVTRADSESRLLEPLFLRYGFSRSEELVFT